MVIDEETADRVLVSCGVVGETQDQVLARLGLLREGLRELTGNRRLMLAMLEQAIKDVVFPSPRQPAEEIAASRAWIAAEYESSIFPDFQTFEGICSALGFCPRRLRQQIDAMDRSKNRRFLQANRLLSNAALGDNVRQRRPKRVRIIPVERAA